MSWLEKITLMIVETIVVALLITQTIFVIKAIITDDENDYRKVFINFIICISVIALRFLFIPMLSR